MKKATILVLFLLALAQVAVATEFTIVADNGTVLRNYVAVNVTTDDAVNVTINLQGVLLGERWEEVQANKSWISADVGEQGQYIAAAVYGGQIWISEDGGDTWRLKNDSAVGNYRHVDISVSGASMCAVIYGGGAYYQFGDEWLNYGTGDWMTCDVSEDGAYIKLADYNSGVIAYSTDSGENWVENTDTLYVYDMDCDDTGMTCWAVGDWQSWLTTDGGATWNYMDEEMSMDGLPLAGGMRAVAQDGEGNVYIVENNVGIYKGNTAGTVWTQVNSNAIAWRGIDVVRKSKNSGSDNVVVATAINGDVYMSDDYGATWTPKSGSTYNFREVAASEDGNLIVAVVNNGKLLISRNQQYSSFAEGSSNNVTFSNLRDGVYYFNATAYNSSGDAFYSETFNVTVDSPQCVGATSKYYLYGSPVLESCVLDANITMQPITVSAVTLNASGITYDCAGMSINSSGVDPEGINQILFMYPGSDYLSDIIIKNCTFIGGADVGGNEYGEAIFDFKAGSFRNFTFNDIFINKAIVNGGNPVFWVNGTNFTFNNIIINSSGVSGGITTDYVDGLIVNGITQQYSGNVLYSAYSLVNAFVYNYSQVVYASSQPFVSDYYTANVNFYSPRYFHTGGDGQDFLLSQIDPAGLGAGSNLSIYNPLLLSGQINYEDFCGAYGCGISMYWDINVNVNDSNGVLAGANVSLAGQSVLTDIDGVAAFSNILAYNGTDIQEYNVTVSDEGYVSDSVVLSNITGQGVSFVLAADVPVSETPTAGCSNCQGSTSGVVTPVVESVSQPVVPVPQPVVTEKYSLFKNLFTVIEPKAMGEDKVVTVSDSPDAPVAAQQASNVFATLINNAVLVIRTLFESLAQLIRWGA